jgi:tetratricopeptide (TPR) repeat protein
VDNRGYSDGLADAHGLHPESLQHLVIDQEQVTEEIRKLNNFDLPLTVKDDVITEISKKSAVEIPEITHKQSFFSLPDINQELRELIRETLNSDNNGQIQPMLREIEQLHIQDAQGEELAIAYHSLGNFYRLQVEEGEASLENLMVAILAYQEAVSYDESSPQLPDILNDLGTLYWMLHRIPNDSEEAKIYIQQGIDFYKLALKVITGDSQPEIYARIQNNLGTAYGDFARFTEPVENWNFAVVAYHEALRYRDEKIEPLKYAACQNNLGTAYWHLGQYNQPVENLTKAIAAYQLATVHYSPTDEPLKYGMIQNNIGTAYWNLSQYQEPVENLTKAINIYNEALKYRTLTDVPHAYAATKNNLGIAYWHLGNQPQTTKEDQQRFIQLCINAYEESLNTAHLFDHMPFSFDLWLTHNNLGLAHYYLVTDISFNGDKKMLSQHLEAALENHLQALSGFDKQTENYQTTIGHIITTIHAFHNQLGIQGQNLALSKLPGQLLPVVLPKL